MKRLAFVVLVTVAVGLLSACPPQNPTPQPDICPGFAHCAVLHWQGEATGIMRGPNCGALSQVATIPDIWLSYTDYSVVAGQSYSYAVVGPGGSSNCVTLAIP